MIYWLLGYFRMNPIMEGREAMALQDFHRIDSHYSNDRCSQSAANRGPWRICLCVQIILLWVCLWTCKLYFYCIMLAAHNTASSHVPPCSCIIPKAFQTTAAFPGFCWESLVNLIGLGLSLLCGCLFLSSHCFYSLVFSSGLILTYWEEFLCWSYLSVF